MMHGDMNEMTLPSRHGTTLSKQAASTTAPGQEYVIIKHCIFLVQIKIT